MPTLTTKSQIWARWSLEEQRLLSGAELLAFIGFDRGCIRPSKKALAGPLSRLAGNAFSAFGIGPVILGALDHLRHAPMQTDDWAQPMGMEEDALSEAPRVSSDSD